MTDLARRSYSWDRSNFRKGCAIPCCLLPFVRHPLELFFGLSEILDGVDARLDLRLVEARHDVADAEVLAGIEIPAVLPEVLHEWGDVLAHLLRRFVVEPF